VEKNQLGIKKNTNYEWLLNHMVRGRYRYIIVRVKDGLRRNKHKLTDTTHTHTHSISTGSGSAVTIIYTTIYLYIFMVFYWVYPGFASVQFFCDKSSIVYTLYRFTYLSFSVLRFTGKYQYTKLCETTRLRKATASRGLDLALGVYIFQRGLN